MADVTLRPRYLTQHVFIPADHDQKPQLESYYRGDQLQVFLNACAAADVLGFSWQATSYMCPTGDPNEIEREFHLTVWREAMSEVLPANPKDGDGG